jgi:hypothetical protein
MRQGRDLHRISGVAGIASALVTFAFGLLHPKGTTDVGSVDEWMTRVHASDVWILVHFMLIWASLLALVALVGIARSYTDEGQNPWARVGVIVAAVTTAIAVLTFLIDGAVVKRIADVWAQDTNTFAATARLATEVGFILVAGLQLGTGAVALAFGIAGLRSPLYPTWLPWLALITAIVGIVPGSANYLFGVSTWSLNFSYVSSALFALWLLVMSRHLLAHARATVA